MNHHDNRTDMNAKEAVAPWAIVVALSVIAAAIVGESLSGVLTASSSIGLVASVLYINYRFNGNPLKFTYDAG